MTGGIAGGRIAREERSGGTVVGSSRRRSVLVGCALAALAWAVRAEEPPRAKNEAGVQAGTAKGGAASGPQAGAAKASGSPRGAANTAPEVVQRLNATLLDVLTHAEQLGYQGRFDRLGPVVIESFDVAYMAEKSLGQHWKALGEADRARWVQVFREFTVANYAGNLDKYSGQRFELIDDEPAANETMVVRTRVVDPGRENVALNYRLHRVDGRWWIFDVFLKGTVSELALRRSDYASILERDGFEGLVVSVRAKIADLAAGRGKRTGV